MSRFYLIHTDGSEEEQVSLSNAISAAAVGECVHICGHDTNPPTPCKVVDRTGHQTDDYPRPEAI